MIPASLSSHLETQLGKRPLLSSLRLLTVHFLQLYDSCSCLPQNQHNKKKEGERQKREGKIEREKVRDPGSVSSTESYITEQNHGITSYYFTKMHWLHTSYRPQIIQGRRLYNGVGTRR